MTDTPTTVERIEPNVTVRPLGPDEWQVYRDLRREMLAKDPTSYPQIAHDSASARTDADWQKRFGESKFIAAFDGQTPVGIAALNNKTETVDGEEVPCALLSNMYVRSTERGKGVGAKLVEGVVKEALGEAIKRGDTSSYLRLEVEKDNPARKFYFDMGFSEVDEKGQEDTNGMITMDMRLI